MAIDRAELARRGIYDPDDPRAEDRLALIDLLVERGATIDQLERDRDDLNALSADLSIRGTGPRLTLAEAAARAGLQPSEATMVLRALGFPAPPAGKAEFTEDEVDLFRFLAALDVFGPEVRLQIIGVLGSSLGRVADAVVAALRLYFEVPMRTAGSVEVDVALAYKELSDTLLPQATHGMDVILRRYLVSAARSSWRIDPQHAATIADLTVGFADVVGFTALTQSISTTELVEIIGAFERGAVDVVTDNGGRVVKFIGDEVMFVVADPAEACRLAFLLTEHFTDHHCVPPVRVGLATGQVLTRVGDHYGRVVNAASRLVDLAEPGGIVVSDGIRDAIGDLFTLLPLPPTRVKGYDDPVEAFRLIR